MFIFSHTSHVHVCLQENDDVLGCIRDPNSNNRVSVVDANNPSRQYSANQLDTDQSGLCAHSTNFNNGRVTCRFVLSHQSVYMYLRYPHLLYVHVFVLSLPIQFQSTDTDNGLY